MDKVPLAELEAFVKKVLATLPAVDGTAVLIALRGNLGSGKTTFVQALCKELGVVEGVKSPTYVLMKSYDIDYKGFTKLIHIDAYRLESPEQFKTLKPETFFHNPHNIVCIEWPERVGKLLPTPDILLNFSSDGASPYERYIEMI